MTNDEWRNRNRLAPALVPGESPNMPGAIQAQVPGLNGAMKNRSQFLHVAKGQHESAGCHIDVTGACIRICEWHPDQTWQIITRRFGAQNSSIFVTGYMAIG